MADHSLEAKLKKNRTILEHFSDEVTRFTGSIKFLVSNLIFFIAWITINSGRVPGLQVVDPYPYILLTMIVSLEAITLSIFVLISQNRQSTIDSIRAEIDLQINEISEREITKALSLLADLHRDRFPKAPPDPQLERMLSSLPTSRITANLEKELENPLIIKDLLEKTEHKLPSFKRAK